MSAIADALRRLGALNLDQSAMKEVLAIVADMETAHDAALAALKAELGAFREEKKRKRRADAKRVDSKRKTERVARLSRDSDIEVVGLFGDIGATVASESRDAPSPSPLLSSSPPHPPNNYLSPSPIPIDDDAGARDHSAKSMISEEAHAISEAIGREAGHSREAWPPGWYGLAYLIQKFLDQGCPGEIAKLGAIAALRRKRDGPPGNFAYFEKPIAAAFAEHNRPLPTVIAPAGQIIEAPNAQRKRTVIDAADDLVARVRALNGPRGIGG